MTKFYFLVIALFSCSLVFAGKKQLVVSNGDWSNASSWNPYGIPQNGDNIVIPAQTTVNIYGQGQKILLNNVTVDVYGILQFGGTIQLLLDNTSSINVHTGGLITGTSTAQKIDLNGWIFEGSKDVIVGPQIATASATGFKTYMETPLALPVKFIGFNLAVAHTGILVQWSTAEEVNALNYEVQRSVDGVTWSAVGQVPAVGNSTQVNTYSFSDKNVNGSMAYYRIKQVDIDGKFTFTAIRSIKTQQSNASVSIAALQNKIAVQFSKPVSGQVELQLLSLNGQVVARQVVSQPVGQVVFGPATPLKGAYVVVVSSASGKTARQVIL